MTVIEKEWSDSFEMPRLYKNPTRDDHPVLEFIIECHFNDPDPAHFPQKCAHGVRTLENWTIASDLQL